MNSQQRKRSIRERTYNEQGATATDKYDNTLVVVVGGDTVETSIVGT